MADVSDLKARREELLRKRESLVSSVRVGDKQVQYDLSQVDEALVRLDREIAEAEGRTPVRRVNVISKSGWA